MEQELSMAEEALKIGRLVGLTGEIVRHLPKYPRALHSYDSESVNYDTSGQ